MFNFNKDSHKDKLDSTISDLLEELDKLPGSDEDYGTTADNVIKLMKLKKELNLSWTPSPDAVVAAAGSVLGILLILNFEKAGVVTSKALSFVGKTFK
jgi:hypothetical protein